MNTLEKANFIGAIITGSAKKQLSEEWTWGAAVSVGIYQGLKYKGSIKNGLAAGAATLIAITGANCIYNIVAFWPKIKEAFNGEGE